MTARVVKNETSETMVDFITLFYETTSGIVTRPHETGGLIGLSWSCNWSHLKPLIFKDGLIGLMVSISRRSEAINSEEESSQSEIRTPTYRRQVSIASRGVVDRRGASAISPGSQKQAYPRKSRIMKELPCLH